MTVRKVPKVPQINVSVSQSNVECLAALASTLGISKAEVVRRALRMLARKVGVPAAGPEKT